MAVAYWAKALSVETGTNAVAYFAKALSVETDKAVQSNRDKLMKQELERYMAQAIGAKPQGFIYAPTSHR